MIEHTEERARVTIALSIRIPIRIVSQTRGPIAPLPANLIGGVGGQAKCTQVSEVLWLDEFTAGRWISWCRSNQRQVYS